MRLAVVIPTISGREELLVACVASVLRTSPARVYVVEGSPSCGEGWQWGGDSAVRDGHDHLMLAADDIELKEGWWQACVAKLERRELPSAVVLNPDGTLQSCGGYWDGEYPDGALTHGTILPFLNLELWQACQPVAPFPHYCDVWISERAVAIGYQPVVCDGFRFVHKINTPITPEETAAWEAWRAAR